MSISVDVLRQIPLFATLSADDLIHVAAVTFERQYDRGDIILLEGESGGALHFVRQGVVKVFKTSPEGKEQVLRLLGPGSTFNDVPALDGGANPASAAALEHSVVLVTGGAELRRMIAERPGVAQAAVQALARALRHLVSVVEDLSFRHVTARVAKLLLEQESLSATEQPAHRLTQQEMASMTGTAREMVGRALKELESAGAIQLQHGHITVLRRDLLQVLL